MDPKSILLPLCGLVLVTLAVWVWMYVIRLTSLYRSGADPQVLADEDQALKIFKKAVNPSDNFENLFELPVLFYAAVLLLYVAGMADGLDLKLAWAYVAFRALHSLIHCTYNGINHRFAAYAISSFVLWAIWIRIAIRLLS